MESSVLALLNLYLPLSLKHVNFSSLSLLNHFLESRTKTQVQETYAKQNNRIVSLESPTKLTVSSWKTMYCLSPRFFITIQIPSSTSLRTHEDQGTVCPSMRPQMAQHVATYLKNNGVVTYCMKTCVHEYDNSTQPNPHLLHSIQNIPTHYSIPRINNSSNLLIFMSYSSHNTDSPRNLNYLGTCWSPPLKMTIAVCSMLVCLDRNLTHHLNSSHLIFHLAHLQYTNSSHPPIFLFLHHHNLFLTNPHSLLNPIQCIPPSTSPHTITK